MQEQLRFDGPPRKVAIVTGGSRGLGREMALSLSMAGADVCLASRTAAQLDATADFIAEKSGRHPLTIPTDVQSSDQCTRLIDQTIEHFGKVDILVNNAGIGDRRGAGSGIWDMADEDWHDTIEVNLYSTFYCSRRVAAYFRGRGEGGVVLNISSGTALRAHPGFAYAAAKAGVISLTKSMASSLAGDGVRVNCIVPGFISQAPPESDSDVETRKARGRFNPARRLGEAWEMGPLAVYLCSDAASYVTGQVIALDGGGLAGGIAPTGHDPAALARASND
jgi:NAD(P)-dependent dehydrogenase (short-subunit alcohol dehydrogenase family)